MARGFALGAFGTALSLPHLVFSRLLINIVPSFPFVPTLETLGPDYLSTNTHTRRGNE